MFVILSYHSEAPECASISLAPVWSLQCASGLHLDHFIKGILEQCDLCRQCGNSVDRVVGATTTATALTPALQLEAPLLLLLPTHILVTTQVTTGLRLGRCGRLHLLGKVLQRLGQLLLREECAT
jgi:hypothetical protein